MIKKRDAVGKLFTPSGNFIILKWGFTRNIVGVEACNLQYDVELDVEYYPHGSGILEINGDYVYKGFPQPREIYIYVKENEE